MPQLLLQVLPIVRRYDAKVSGDAPPDDLSTDAPPRRLYTMVAGALTPPRAFPHRAKSKQIEDKSAEDGNDASGKDKKEDK